MSTPLVPDHGKVSAELLVVKSTMDEFQEEEPTKPEATESLVETLERLRSRTETARERPSVRMKAITPEDL